MRTASRVQLAAGLRSFEAGPEQRLLFPARAGLPPWQAELESLQRAEMQSKEAGSAKAAKKEKEEPRGKEGRSSPGSESDKSGKGGKLAVASKQGSIKAL